MYFRLGTLKVQYYYNYYYHYHHLIKTCYLLFFCRFFILTVTKVKVTGVSQDVGQIDDLIGGLALQSRGWLVVRHLILELHSIRQSWSHCQQIYSKENKQE